MDVVGSRSPSPSRLRPPSSMPAPLPSAVDRVALERLVLNQLFNGARPPALSAPRPMETVAALYSRLATQRDFSTVIADQQTLIDALRHCSRYGALRAAFSLDNCSLGKVLHVLCRVWRERSELDFDPGLLVEAATLCGDLIERKAFFKLETCGVIMFHLGELITYPPLRPMCERLICDHLEPRFRAELRSQLHLPLNGPEVVFGLISTLRAAEGRVVAAAGALSPRTAADKLVTTVHMLLLRQPGFLGRCESTTLALLARHAAHYLHRLAALPDACRASPTANERERSVAQLLRRCIDEVNVPGPRDADLTSGRTRGDCSGHLRHAVPCYLDWLAGQAGLVRTRFAPRGAEPCPRLLRFQRAVEGLAEEGGGPCAARDQALAAADALIVSMQLGSARPPLATQVRVLLSMDTLYRHLEAANPISSQPYTPSLAVLREFMTARLSELVDASGAPLLGPSPPLQAGLHSWQRMLLSQLDGQPGKGAGV